MEEKKTNYDKTREDAEQHFLAYDQEKMIRKFSLKADEKYLYLRFVGRDYRISRKNGRIEWNREEIGKDYFEPAQAGLSWMCSAARRTTASWPELIIRSTG